MRTVVQLSVKGDVVVQLRGGFTTCQPSEHSLTVPLGGNRASSDHRWGCRSAHKHFCRLLETWLCMGSSMHSLSIGHPSEHGSSLSLDKDNWMEDGAQERHSPTQRSESQEETKLAPHTTIQPHFGQPIGAGQHKAAFKQPIGAGQRKQHLAAPISALSTKEISGPFWGKSPASDISFLGQSASEYSSDLSSDVAEQAETNCPDCEGL
ncbi:hypothetical protein BDZ45DRAFT_740010 [Acephala macrosclerotiorum]|nr:hypothetical protein BDZ45DRAFT_740010 [Acephala macrosclerotiorum]